MPKFLPKDSSDFPLPETAESDGLLAFGSNMKTDTLLKAYSLGIFPWFNERELIYWYTPDPRFVLYPGKIKISHSMRNVFNKGVFKFSVDKAFPEVIRNCRTVKRAGNPGSWISDEFEIAYNNLFAKGYAHSAEAWHNNALAGGLYGVLIGKVFLEKACFQRRVTQANLRL